MLLSLAHTEEQSQACCLRSTTRATRNILAIIGVSTAGDVDALPGPVAAGAAAAENVDWDRVVTGAGACDAVDGYVGDRDARGGGAGWGAVLVVLLDYDAVTGDA